MAKRKKKIKPVPKENEIQEYGGYTLGQEVWVMLHRYGREEWGYGTILGFYPKDKTEPSFDFFDKLEKRYTTGAISNIAESPPKRWLGKVRKK